MSMNQQPVRVTGSLRLCPYVSARASSLLEDGVHPSHLSHMASKSRNDTQAAFELAMLCLALTRRLHWDGQDQAGSCWSVSRSTWTRP